MNTDNDKQPEHILTREEVRKFICEKVCTCGYFTDWMGHLMAEHDEDCPMHPGLQQRDGDTQQQGT